MTKNLFDDSKLWKERIESALSNIADRDQQQRSWKAGESYFPDPVELCVTLTDDDEFEEYLRRHIGSNKADLYYARLHQDGLELLKRIKNSPNEKLRDVGQLLLDPEWDAIRNLSASILKRLQAIS